MRIDITRLGPTCAKTVQAASFFVDLDGYTALVDSLDGDTDELAKAVGVLHLFRYELRQVSEIDHDGIARQHQGDCLQGLLHVPGADDADIMENAVDLCIACNSSVEDVLNVHHADLVGKLHVAIGCAFGKALVGMLGTKGDRDPVCIGKATMAAEDVQLAMAGNHVGLTKGIYDSITDEEIKRSFTWNKGIKCYMASGVTFTSIEETEAAKQYATSKSAGYSSAGAIIVGSRAAEHVPLKVTRPYSE